MYELILASQSPRRKKLLMEKGYNFQVHLVKVSENIEENLNPQDFAQTLSRRKAKSLVDSPNNLNFKGKIVLAADTIVGVDESVLGKPKNIREAFQFLTRLSGRAHCVITAFTLIPDGDWSLQVTEFVKTEVCFRSLTDVEIKSYIDSGEPMDKAGAYGIQGQGAQFVKEYKGSWSNVVGLPMEKLDECLKKQGWNVKSSEA